MRHFEVLVILDEHRKLPIAMFTKYDRCILTLRKNYQFLHNVKTHSL